VCPTINPKEEDTMKATRESLETLWTLTLGHLVTKASRSKPSAELLGLARQFMQDNHHIGPVDTPKVRKQLEQLHAAYLQGLVAAMGDGVPTASLIHESRLCLEKAERDQQAIEASTGHPSIPGGVPFNTH